MENNPNPTITPEQQEPTDTCESVSKILQHRIKQLVAELNRNGIKAVGVSMVVLADEPETIAATIQTTMKGGYARPAMAHALAEAATRVLAGGADE